MANRVIEIQQRLDRKYRSEVVLTPAASLSRRTKSFSGQSFDCRFDVPLVPQLTGMSCWAAAAAMVVGWREKLSMNPEEIAKGAGEWASYSVGLHPENASIFPVWGLTPEPQQSYTPEGFLRVLENYGPLWVAGAVPGPHVRVVTGMYGDGTRTGTKVIINDPWQKGMTTFSMPNSGSQYEMTYEDFVAETERLAIRELPTMPNAIYVARSTKPRVAGAQWLGSHRYSRQRSARSAYPVMPNFHARSFALPVDFLVARAVTPASAPSAQTIWAAATAILASARTGHAVPLDLAVQPAGERYVQMLRTNGALRKGDMTGYVTALGLVAEPLPSLTVEKVHDLLRKHGPIWLSPESPATFSFDARVITGIRGDGTAAGTEVQLIDPANGTISSVVLDKVAALFKHEDPARPASAMTAIYWPATMLSDAPVPKPATNGGAPAAMSMSGHRQSFAYSSPSMWVHTKSGYSYAQNPAAGAALITAADAAQIGLGAVQVAQSAASSPGGSSLQFTYAQASRLLTNEARQQMPGAQEPKQSYRHLLFEISISNWYKLNAANANLMIEWDGNRYGEIGTPVIRQDLSSTSDWTQSSLDLKIIKVDRIPLPKTDPRGWPIVYSYEGVYNPYGAGKYEFQGEFEVNAFGGLKFNDHRVESRSLLGDVAIWAEPGEVVRKGNDVIMPIPEIPADQMAYLRSKLP